MENKKEMTPGSYVPTEEERLDRQWKKRFRELKIARTRASVVRSQIVESYKILEIIKFDYVGDTMFRDYITVAKKNLEAAVNDFLLSDIYHEKRIKDHTSLTRQEYDEQLKQPVVQQGPTPK